MTRGPASCIIIVTATLETLFDVNSEATGYTARTKGRRWVEIIQQQVSAAGPSNRLILLRLDGVEVMALCRPVKFLHTKLEKTFLYGRDFVNQS